jgi:N6-adenosine-specific RNA methylase IME4
LSEDHPALGRQAAPASLRQSVANSCHVTGCRAALEALLVGTRGDIPAPAMGTQFPSIVRSPVRDPSEKPDFAYEIAERHFPNLPKIELNARRHRPGWDAWGLEAP